MNNFPFTDWKQKHIAIHCVFKDKDKEDIKLTDKTYDTIKDAWDNANIEIIDEKWRIQFQGKRREIREFRFVYPKEDSTPDEYKLYSIEYNKEKDKRDAFYKNLKPTEEEQDIVWSMIFAKWGKTYLNDDTRRSAWKAYFRWMFKILMLELKGYKDKISSNTPIMKLWQNKIPYDNWQPQKELEMHELWQNVEEYRKFKASV